MYWQMVNEGLQRLIIDALDHDKRNLYWYPWKQMGKPLYKYTASKYSSNWGYFKNT